MTTNDATSDAKNTATTFVGDLLADFLRAFMLMLGMGALHSQIAAVPHPGYWTSFFIIWGVQAIASAVRRPTSA